MVWTDADGRFSSGLMLLGATGALFIACRAAVGAVATVDDSGPGRRAFAYWLPVVTTTLAAVFLGQGEVAVAIIFGTSVAYLSLVLGMATYVTPMQSAPSRPRAWPFVLPAALLSLVAGFGGVLTWLHALMFLVLGLAILGVWTEEPPAAEVEAVTETDLPVTSEAERERLGWIAPVQLALAVLLAGTGGWVAVQATIATAAHVPIAGPAFIAVAVLSPMLILPTLRVSTQAAQTGNVEAATSALVGTVLLNLCVLLPMVVLLWYLVGALSQWSTALATTQPVSLFSIDLSKVTPLPYPVGVWRLETVVLVILGFVLVPVAMGRWFLARQESMLLVVGYVIYLASVVLTLRAR